MGMEIEVTEFSPKDYENFRARLEENLAELYSFAQEANFGKGPRTLGAELEVYIVDERGLPLYINQEIMDDAQDPELTVELNRYNLEFTMPPTLLAERPFESMEQNILRKLASTREVAAKRGGRIVPIGILPTLRQSDFGPHCITERQRFHALVRQLIERRGGDFRIDIHGEDPLKLENTFNSVQLMTPLALAIGANSPTLFGHSLWHETRIPLFKQSIDTRHVDPYSWNEPARVGLGQGWVRRSAAELFREVVRIYPPLLPVCIDQEPREPGQPPTLMELRLHQSTVWLWNRPVYDDNAGGHLRVEMRSLPAGPTAVDMVANAAFLIGLAEGIRPRINELLPSIPFHIAEYNFHRAAQHGLDARLVWPSFDQAGFREEPVVNIIERMLPLAREGLDAIGIDGGESQRYLDVIERRLVERCSGAIWQRRMLEKLREKQKPKEALHAMLEQFIEHSTANVPVAEWPL
jgi:gamma-glutamyl:cysteine ligase YbdK (ATP-grasp superfamily)